MAKARTRRPQAQRPAPARSRRPAAKSSARTTRVGQSSRKALSPHKGDIQGVFLVLLAVVMALGIWFEDGGRLGAFMALLFRNLFGYGAYAVPLLVAGLALALFWRPSTKDDMVAGRVTIGLLAMLVGGLGLLHLARGAPPADSAPAVLQDSGGLAGAIVAAPLARLLSTWGAGALFACVLFLGTLISTRTSVAAVARGITSMGRLAGSTLTAPPRPPPPPPAPPEVVEPVDSGEAPPRRRGRRRPEPAPEPDPDDTIEVVVGPPGAEAGKEAPAGAEERDEAAALKAPPPPIAPADLPGAGDAVQLAMTLQARAGGAYTTPPESLLRQGHARPVDPRRLDETQRILEKTLEQFEVDAKVPRYTRGPTVTRYEVELGPATKVARVIGLSHDIAYALASPDVRIIAPIPGKSAIGIEVPNRDRELVTLGDILDATGKGDDRHPLTVALGKDIGGEPVLTNLAEMPHVLIAGSTGAGKSVCLNVLVTSLLMRNAPDEVRMILIDPKRVELTHYENVPHLITPVVTHPKRASEALAWAVREMELRLETLAIAGVRNIAAYNKAARDGTLPPLPSAGLDDEGRSGGLKERSGSPPVDPPRQRPTLPYIVVVIDELSDLMMVAPRDVEDAICRIAQMARAVGIHLVVATQRPSVDVVTGLIKANIPSRIAFMVASAQDSRVILDAGGADKLVGHGDMLYLPGGTSKPRRVQGAFITEKEVEAVVAYCKAQQQAAYQPGVVAEGRAASEDDDGDEDPLLTQAMEIVVRSGLGSTSMLQSKMKVGFSRARRIMDQLEERGVVGPSEGSKPRDVLMTVEELEQVRGREETYGEIVSE
ncbi:MAG TPA: DNA translocase FtsK 4TM domain-containing protein [Actinomycetota bacterium]|nr:DNA translocase FtsK 4TM domain-containing protein [Actinomycetota bacterium]